MSRSAWSTPATVSLVHLQHCLVNLPSQLESLLVSVGTPAQNVVVEVTYRSNSSHHNSSSNNASSSDTQSIYLGWTGMASKRRIAPPGHQNNHHDSHASYRSSSRDSQPLPFVEIDSSLGRLLGLQNGQPVQTSLHVDPVTAHTINIEPLTTEDWEIIELHATFLELNMLSQIRAVPNPSARSAQPYPLTVHLSPTTTANIRVTSIEPVPSSRTPFVKIAPDAEVIVAPKPRSHTTNSKNMIDNRSVASTTTKSKRSTTVGASSGRRQHEEVVDRTPLLSRAVCRSAYTFFDKDNEFSSTESSSTSSSDDHEFTVWIDPDVLASSDFSGVNYVTVEFKRPLLCLSRISQAAKEEPTEIYPPAKIVARVKPLYSISESPVVVLSTALSAAFGRAGFVGGIVKLLPASSPLPKSSLKSLKIIPFTTLASSSLQNGATHLRLGGDSKSGSGKAELVKAIRQMYSAGRIFTGPLTHGMILDVYPGLAVPPAGQWEGGLLQFVGDQDSSHRWTSNLDEKFPLEVETPVPRPLWLRPDYHGCDLHPKPDSKLAGLHQFLPSATSKLQLGASTLLTGALGSGKTQVAKELAQQLREKYLAHTLYYSCKTLVTDEVRVSTIKQTLTHIVVEATMGARLGGQSLVVLDDLDKLFPAETELQVGNDNARSRILSETFCGLVRQYCTSETNVVLLATSESRDSLHNVVVAGHVFRNVLRLQAPDKEARRQILESIAKENAIMETDISSDLYRDNDSRPRDDHPHDVDDWMEYASSSNHFDSRLGPSGHERMNSVMGPVESSPSSDDGFVIDKNLDFLDLAGLTDGYMPADLSVLVSRARNEAMFRAIQGSMDPTAIHSGSTDLRLTKADFEKALSGYTPATLRNVPLQKSTMTFSSIGGLQETRQVLLETLQYPTKYAPIFSKCPLRLRSGLLLYGYPGCGKTLLASAVAGECGLNFISVKGPEILNKYIGASEKSVRDLFERAQAAKPCVLFFDEFDSIAPKRGHDSTGVTDRVVNQLLTQMDGAEGLSGVYVLAATSRPDLIDPALLRPGRLDKSLLCDLPSQEDRVDILRAMSSNIHLPKEFHDTDECWQSLALRTNGFSGADMQALISNAQLEAIHEALLDPTAAHTSSTPRNRKDSNVGASFVKFRYGDDGDDAGERQVQSKAAILMEDAAIQAKLDALRLSRQQSAQNLTTSSVSATASKNNIENTVDSRNTENDSVMVEWRHFVKALESTRPSISVDESNRLRRIYKEFVGERSGEMRDGQGSFEVGGRSSLM